MRNDSFTSTFSVRNVLVTTAILASMSLAAGAFAQAPPPGVPPATPPANRPANLDKRPPLGGPQVDPGAADSEKGFNGGKQGGKKGRAESGVMLDERMKDVAWMRTYESMKPTLSADTLNKTEAIKAVYEVAMKTWNDANADKMKALREQMKGQKDEKAGKAAAEQMKALRDTWPKMEETQKQIFALLSESEQATFKTKLEANEKQMRSLRSKDGSADAGGNADGKGKGGKGKGGKGAQGGQGGKPGDGQPPEGGSDKAPPPPPFDP
jgi:hypothetical protein